MNHIPPTIYKDGSLIRMEGCVQPGIEDCNALRATIKRVEAARDEMKRRAEHAVGDAPWENTDTRDGLAAGLDESADLLDAALRGEGRE